MPPKFFLGSWVDTGLNRKARPPGTDAPSAVHLAYDCLYLSSHHSSVSFLDLLAKHNTDTSFIFSQNDLQTPFSLQQAESFQFVTGDDAGQKEKPTVT